MRFEDTRFACIDFETTGFSPNSSRAIELAIVDVQHGEIGESWTSLLNPALTVTSAQSIFTELKAIGLQMPQPLVTSQAIFIKG